MGCSLNVKPLHLTTYGPNGGFLHVAEALIAAGADVNCAMSNGRTALHEAARKNAFLVAEVLLGHGCVVDSISMENNEHKTPLFHAIEFGSFETAQCLLKAGANINARDSLQVTPLITAVFTGKKEAVKMLIDSGCDLDLESQNGTTALKASLTPAENPYTNSCSMTLCKLLVMSGCELSTDVQGLILRAVKKARTKADVRNPQDLDWLVWHCSNPFSLQQISRILVRTQLGSKCQSKVGSLPLPGELQRYLCFSDV